MKKVSKKQRMRDVQRELMRRRGVTRDLFCGNKATSSNVSQYIDKSWLDENLGSVDVRVKKKNQITLSLPEVMNFSNEYEATVSNISAIRKLGGKSSNATHYKLVTVDFDKLRKISTSAALVLTAELSKWDDEIRQRLRPEVGNWDKAILRNFRELGFFGLFKNCNTIEFNDELGDSSNLKVVQYIKGRIGDSDKARLLKENITGIVGEEINKWMFLHGGLTEAVTNVGHHAYPDGFGFSEREKNWYLTGAFNDVSKELKIVFYDQGIGIPKSLPASEIWERILKVFSKIPLADRKKDEVLLKAAVELDRTSTYDSDRGKGLQDLLEFIKQRENGYLSIISSKGLYKYELVDGEEKIKAERFHTALRGTLIIWNAQLTN
ncbi:hypothetical protein [Cycloclasticus sp.]|uniref:hypothetical protein n=1 Tax=Cycloclasticus sp. TaxID=2024830 RepID=UPI000C104E6C|nr:hypothetical protein [Cycloclasticus sp.]PHR52028.1 MAG: hypothetical protein COA48_02835 [Cycloclasticus sp.]